MKHDIDVALEKFETIAPLLSDNLSTNDKRIVRHRIIDTTGWSERTLRRTIANYRKQGFDGLRPKERCDKGSTRAIEPLLLEYAAQVRDDEPQLSVDRIVEILRVEGKGSLSRSTLDRQLRQIGKSRKEILRSKKSSGRRFARIGRNTLWQSDVKYGPTLTGPDNSKIKTYMIAIIDDATRYICHSEFYTKQNSVVLEDCIRKALLKCGLPGALYVDNGPAYRKKQLKLACARLGFELLNAAPYNCQGKGKVEKFNQTMEEFLHASRIEPSDNLVQFNARYQNWLDEGYNRRIHGGLKDKSPHTAFHTDEKPLRVSTFEAIRKAFLKEETRQVDNSGCFSLDGILFDAGADFCRKRIEVHFDALDLSTADIYYNGQFKNTVQPAVIGEFCNHKAGVTVEKTLAKQSRLLNALSKSRTERLKREGVINFGEETAVSAND